MASSDQGHVRFACPDCGARLKAPAERGGKYLRCPECGEAVHVPENGAPVRGGGPISDERPSEVETWIAVDCLVCGTRMHARPHEVGQKIQCPDCDTVAVVRPPPPPAKKRELTPPRDGYALRDEAPPSRGRFEGPTIEVVCPHCGHRQEAPAAQQGRKLSCSGCFLVFVVPAPAPVPERPPEELEAEDDGLRLSEPAPRRRPTIPDFVLEAEEESPLASSASSAPFASRPELSRPLGPRPELPDWPLIQGVLLFPFSRGVWTRWLNLSLGAAAILILVSNAVAVSQGGPGRGWALALLYSALAVFGAGLWYVFGPSILLAIFQDTAAGNDNVENWPDGPWIDTALEGLYLLSALGVTAIVSVAAMHGAQLIGLDLNTAVSLAGLVGFVAFPVFLLSMIEQGSMLLPVSGPVWGSLLSGWRWWLSFFIVAFLLDLALGAVLAAVVRVLPMAGIGLTQMGLLSLGAALVVGYLIVYFRLLGRLAWCCEEVLAERAAARGADESPRLNERRPVETAPAAAPAAHQPPRYEASDEDDGDFLSGI